MSQFQTAYFARADDGLLQVDLKQPTDMTGWAFQVDFLRRFGGVPLKSCYYASGMNNVSGVNLLAPGNQSFQVVAGRELWSGKDPLNYAFQAYRTDSGVGVQIAAGYVPLSQ